MSFKQHQDLPDLTKLLERAQNAMLGFAPDWGGSLLTSIASSGETYPPYNLVKHNEHSYEIQMALAGFSSDELDISVQKNNLIISGKRKRKPTNDEVATLIHQGISTRPFTKTFLLAENTDVVEADFKNGLLIILVERKPPPEEMPKQIQIKVD